MCGQRSPNRKAILYPRRDSAPDPLRTYAPRATVKLGASFGCKVWNGADRHTGESGRRKIHPCPKALKEKRAVVFRDRPPLLASGFIAVGPPWLGSWHWPLSCLRQRLSSQCRGASTARSSPASPGLRESKAPAGIGRLFSHGQHGARAVPKAPQDDRGEAMTSGHSRMTTAGSRPRFMPCGSSEDPARQAKRGGNSSIESDAPTREDSTVPP